jgi:A/G-specific adenine glycosylase
VGTVREIENIIYPLGLRWRAPLIKQLATKLTHDESLYNSVEDLPAVGPYVSAAFRSFYLRERSVLVDSNIVRWLARLIGQSYDNETRRKKWVIELADVLTPENEHRDYNYAVLDFTMTICGIKPKCDVCPVAQFCAYHQTADSPVAQ